MENINDINSKKNKEKIFFRGDVHCMEGEYTAALIVSNSINNASNDCVTVAMIKDMDKSYPTQVQLNNECVTGCIICEQVHTVKKEVIGDKIGSLSNEAMDDVLLSMSILFEIRLDEGFSEKIYSKFVKDEDVDNSKKNYEKIYEQMTNDHKAQMQDLEKKCSEEKEQITRLYTSKIRALEKEYLKEREKVSDREKKIWGVKKHDNRDEHDQLIKALAERDIYKELYLKMVDK